MASTSNAENPKISNNFLAELFECPICYEYALPPIYQCKSGHLICSVCRPKCVHSNNGYPVCPSCRQPLDEIRNTVLEKISSVVSFPCKYSTFGCPVKTIPSQKEYHEDSCKFKFQCVPCPLPSSPNSSGYCEWSGRMEDIKCHIISAHPTVTTLAGQDIIFLVAGIFLPASADWIMLQEAHGETFLVVFSKRKHEENESMLFYAFVVLIGTPKKAKQFAYRLALNARKKRLSWEAVPKAILGEKSSLHSDSLRIDEEMAAIFSKNQDLAINVVISQNSDSEASESSDSEDENSIQENNIELA